MPTNETGFEKTAEFYAEQIESDTVTILEALLEASTPYLWRKKGTPRHQCDKLNKVHVKAMAHIKLKRQINEMKGEG